MRSNALPRIALLKPPPISKAELRRELDRQLDAYLREGGQVHEIPRGISGRDSIDGPLPNAPFVGEGERNPREYLTDVIAGIEARRKPIAPPKHIARRPRKKIIYDDFGEPIRWVWEE
jgi:hypothetical protein